MIKVVFENSGDELVFASTNPHISEYYIDQLNTVGLNDFSLAQPLSVSQSMANISAYSERVNKFLYPLSGKRIPIFDTKGYLSQRNLNALHSEWVKSQSVMIDVAALRRSDNPDTVAYANKLFDMLPDDHMTPTLGEVLTKLDLMNEYSKINSGVHNLEQLASGPYKFATDKWIEIPNIFDKTCATNDRFNLSLPFNHLGRTLFNKYTYFDSELEFSDENTFNELLGFVEIRLHRPVTSNYSADYLEWCKRVNREPSGDRINLGHIVDIEQKLDSYRMVIYRNLEKNYKISLHV
jgi:hypothetical protein